MKVMPAKSQLSERCWLVLYLLSFGVSNLATVLNLVGIHLVFKSCFVPLLSLYAYLHWPRPLNKPFYILQVAYLCAWIGDILMVFHKQHELCFTIGAGLFLAQHNLYIWLNLLAKGKGGLFWHQPYWGLHNLMYVVLFSLAYISDLKKIVMTETMIYAFFLATAFTSAVTRDMENKHKYRMIVLGLLLFIVSDSILSLDKFVFELPLGLSTSINITYYVAQTLLLFGYIPDTYPSCSRHYIEVSN